MRNVGAPRHPNVLFASDHFAGWSGAQDKAAMTTALEGLAQLPNAYLRLSSTSLMPADLTPPEQELFRRVIEGLHATTRHVGFQLPLPVQVGTSARCSSARRPCPGSPTDDRRWIMGETAHTLWPMLQGPARGVDACG